MMCQIEISVMLHKSNLPLSGGSRRGYHRSAPLQWVPLLLFCQTYLSKSEHIWHWRFLQRYWHPLQREILDPPLPLITYCVYINFPIEMDIGGSRGVPMAPTPTPLPSADSACSGDRGSPPLNGESWIRN